ncbi:hypothetical protein F183_A13100 [Bryobacterales bacterium F-183]|nr:hypothetical protein F183_A13100 [Bryobacterales bacterium F-183]
MADDQQRLEIGHSGGISAPLRFPLRLVTWNIERGYRLNDIARTLQELKADICLLQEVDRNVRRTSNRHVARELASRLGFHFALGIAFEEVTQGKGAFQGQATLSRYPFRAARVLTFQRQSGFWKPRWFVPDTPPFQERLGGRIALRTDFERPRIVMYNLHLESRGPEELRARQLEEVLRDAPSDAAVVIAGDLNTKAGPHSPCVELLRKAGFQDAVGQPELFTTSRGGALAKLFIAGALDWIWYRGPVGLEAPGEVQRQIRVSDHYPLVAEFHERIAQR